MSRRPGQTHLAGASSYRYARCMMAERILIIGAGHAGGSAAAFLRQYGFEGEIVLAGDEPLAPYQRPPLSKAWLKGEADSDSLLLRPESFYEQQAIVLRRGLRAERLNRADRTVNFTNGEVLGFDRLILATGARARVLDAPGADLAGILALRSAADADALKAALRPGVTLAVVGGGYVGLEAAASARTLGCDAVVLEREARLLARVASVPMAAFFEAYHLKHGVRIVTGANVAGFVGEGGAVKGVALADGSVVACDVALVGVGAVPNVELARDAGLDCADGVIVNSSAQTNDPAIYAVGDVTHRPLPHYDRSFRLESVPNALEQAKQAACAITGRPPPAPEVPWFWSDQYDLKLQIAGIPFDADQVVLRGSGDEAPFAVFHLKDNRVLAVEAVNAAAEFMGGRLLIGRQTLVDPIRLADLAIPMKAVAG
jgi:3-phenylpropionate/trans-cinnamate dioxygenase ferredoxin reductase subunit